MVFKGYAFTPKPLHMGLIIQDPKSENGEPFTYPDQNIDMIMYNENLEFEGLFDHLSEILPAHCCEFSSNMFTYPANWRSDPEWILSWNKASIRALDRLAAFIRKCVSEMGEFWYVQQWNETIAKRPENMNIREMNIDDLKYKGDNINSFEFKADTFYKFVDI
jgi:hypothetical protein